MINIFILCTKVIIEHIFVGLFKTWLYLSKNLRKIDFPYHAIIEHRTMC